LCASATGSSFTRRKTSAWRWPQEAARRREIAEELADVVIYALEFANVTGIDLATAIKAKLAANAKKYPIEKARGRADKYTEL
jgi:NTP pyrophosphatase (non-canonical NTP hydrolase)